MDEAAAAILVKQAKSHPHSVLAKAEKHHLVMEPKARALLEFARARALYEIAENDASIVAFDTALALGDGELRDRIGISMAAAELAGGQRDEATSRLEQIERTTDSEVVAQLASCQLALIELGAGDVRQARDRLIVVIPVLESDSDEIDSAARALANLAYCEMTLGNLDDAADLYRRAINMGQHSQEALVVAGCLQNLAYIDVLRGRFPHAISGLEEAYRAYVSLGSPSRNMSSLFDDMAETYGLAGLTRDAVNHAREALLIVADGANGDKIAEAKLRLASCLLNAGEAPAAGALAGEAVAAFVTAGRPIWAHRACGVEIESLAGEYLPEGLLSKGIEAARELGRKGWHLDSRKLLNRVAQALIEGGDLEQAGFILGEQPEAATDSPPGALERVFSLVLLAEAQGQSPDAALNEARGLLWEHQIRLADPELRAGVGRLRERFRSAALRNVRQDASPISLLATEERWRALAAGLPRVVPLADKDLASLSAQVRLAAAASDAAPRDDEKASLRRDLERKLRGASLGGSAASAHRLEPQDLHHDALIESLADRVFIEWLIIGIDMYAVAVIDGVTTSWQLEEPAAALQARATQLVRDLGRVLRPGLNPDRLGLRWKQLQTDATELARRLVPFALPPGRGAVLSPARGISGLPYSLLIPDARSIQMTASATAWVQRPRSAISGPMAAFVGPGLSSGVDDARAVQGMFPTASVYKPPRGTTSELAGALQQSSILHIAAHGTFRAESPMLSSILLADGEFTLYELGSGATPDLVTFSSCDTGRAVEFVGGESIGFASVWLAAGTRRLIAPICPIPDVYAVHVTAGLYRNLPGRTPETALAMAQKSAMDDSILGGASASAYQSWGPDVGFVLNGIPDPSG